MIKEWESFYDDIKPLDRPLREYTPEERMRFYQKQYSKTNKHKLWRKQYYQKIKSIKNEIQQIN